MAFSCVKVLCNSNSFRKGLGAACVLNKFNFNLIQFQFNSISNKIYALKFCTDKIAVQLNLIIQILKE